MDRSCLIIESCVLKGIDIFSFLSKKAVLLFIKSRMKGWTEARKTIAFNFIAVYSNQFRSTQENIRLFIIYDFLKLVVQCCSFFLIHCNPNFFNDFIRFCIPKANIITSSIFYRAGMPNLF